MAAPKKVAILGGGVAGLSAAYELSRPEHAGAFDVTVYQVGWRLGGKGASSRNPDHHDRIEEHGLHLWMGCYENAFRVIRDCYDAIGLDWTKAFTPHHTTVLEEHYDGRWSHWPTTFPELDTRPGEHDDVASPEELMGAMMRWLWRAITPWDDDVEWGPSTVAGGRLPPSRLRRPFEIASRAMFSSPRLHGVAATALDALRRLAWATRGHRLDDTSTRRILLTIDFVVANLVGVLREGLLVPAHGRIEDATYADWLENVQRIDDLHYPDWLMKHGARRTTAESCITRGLGDAVFNSGHQGSAAAALNGLVRLNLTFRGSVFFKMSAGMGETVFTPLYQALRQRGVKFEFFHRVDAVHVDARREVTSVDVTRQVELATGTYEPLIRFGALDCWPHTPRWEQIRTPVPAGLDLEAPVAVPREQARTLRAGVDFDDVVLAISIGALRPITEDLSRVDSSWGEMLDAIGTTATQSVQLWWRSSHRDMGWDHGPAVATAYAESLDTFAEMSHLLEVESFAEAEACSYFVGSITDLDDPALQPARQTRDADRWFADHLAHLLPGAMSRGAVDTAKIVDRYDRVNTRPSDRYVLSLPGTGRHRRFADRSGFGRLFLAGDWTKTGMNVGSVEAAVMSGLRAARGVSGRPVKIVGDFD